MTVKDRIRNEYFEWMYDLICHDRYAETISYRKLLMCLHNTEFIFILPMDENRAADGVSLRFRFALSQDQEELVDYLDGPCSILEMMIALACRFETIVDDPDVGDRSSQWFWNMIVSLGLGSETDDQFDKRYTKSVLDRFMYRKYDSDGRGGLFTVSNPRRDMRDIEIWSQMNDYMKKIL